jgi:hypothetical protein
VIALTLVFVWLAPRVGIQLAALPFAGAFGFIGAAFGVVLGFSAFFANQHYSNFRTQAQDEATALGNVAAMVGSLPPAQAAASRAELYCYATDVIDKEWPKMATGRGHEGATSVEDRERAQYVILLRAGREAPRPLVWYSNAVSQSLDVGQARQQRLLLSQPQIPGVLWFLIYVGSALIVLFTCFFHLKSKRQLRGMLVAVVVMLFAVVLVLAGLDAPTQDPFGLEPSAMRIERRLIGQIVDTHGMTPARFCATLPPVRGSF